jgi:hypothetical protein
MGRNTSGLATNNPPIEPPSSNDSAQGAVGTGVDTGLAVVEKQLAAPIGEAVVAAVEMARGLSAGVLGIFGIGVGMALAYKQGKSASGIAAAGFAGLAAAELR